VTRFEALRVEAAPDVLTGAHLAPLPFGLTDLRDGDILVVTSKIVSKSEGRVISSDRETALAAETDRVVARRGPTTIVRTHHGLVMAAAGIDASNTDPGTVVLLPRDPDASARGLRERLREYAGANVGVVVSDTSGRAWREGQTDIAVGAAGIVVLDDHAGRVDPYGNALAVTAPALADEIAAAGDLAKGKLSGHPVALLRGLEALVLPPAEHGPGASALTRAEGTDLFGYGSREAVLRALAPGGDRGRGFGAPAPAAEVADVLATVLGPGTEVLEQDGAVVARLTTTDPRDLGRAEARAEAALRAHGWRLAAGDSAHSLTCRPATP